MSSILGPIQRLAELLNGLSSDLGDTLTSQLTGPPLQPQSADFPLMLIEFAYEDEGLFQTHSLGAAHNVYPISIMIFVGAPALGTAYEEMHNHALAWVKPLATKIFSNITLDTVDNVLVVGFGTVDQGSEDILRYRVGEIQWNQQTFYGLRVKTWIKEDFNLEMA